MKTPRTYVTRARDGLRARLARAAALVAVTAMTLTGCEFSVYNLPLPGGADLGENPYAVTVKFNDVLDLVPQSAVKVDDVTVGRVDDVSLDGYTAEVTVLVREDVKLPDNAIAEIRQTSLLGEKFVSLEPPPSGASSVLLGDGDVIGLDRSGRNPEVEEVLGALSLLLNGGGVAQLKTISTELSKALEGRESNVKSVLQELDTFMGQLNDNKGAIVQAIERVNKLAVSLNGQEATIKSALDNMPRALASINRQRDDLVRMLRALSELSGVATRVIRESKVATIDSLEALTPTLTKLAEAGESLPNALQVFLTYPFVDAVVGKNPAQARNLHMGDYTNLSVQIDLDLTGESDAPLPDPTEECEGTPLEPVCNALPKPDLIKTVEQCLLSEDITSDACRKAFNDGNLFKLLKEQCQTPEHAQNPVCRVVNPIPEPGPGQLPQIPGLPSGAPAPVPPAPLPSIPGLGLNRTGFGPTDAGGAGSGATTGSRYDNELAPLLVWGMVQR